MRQNTLKCETEYTGVQCNDKDPDTERQAKIREYHRNYRAKLRAKVDVNGQRHPNPSLLIANNTDLITDLVTARLLLNSLV